MLIELSLLKAMSVKENLNTYLHLLNPKTLSKESVELLNDYKTYFSLRVTQEAVDFNDFSSFFFIERHPNLDDKSIEKWKTIISKVQKLPLEGNSCTNIIAAFEQQELYAQLHQDLDKNVPLETVVSKMETARQKLESLKSISNALEEDMDLTLALSSTDRSKGLQWRLNCLRELFEDGGLVKGDFGIIAGYVDSGKTSFLCSEISHMAQQLEGDQWIAWLNTEGSWQQIVPRIYSATLNCTQADLRKFPDSAKEKYTKLMKGNRNRIRVLNFQRKSTKDVEDLIRHNPPSLIIFDLLDGLRGFEKFMGGDGNVTERYSQLYQWAREVATQYCPVLAISQLNGDGNNEPYPTITNLRGSRVDKQAAATFQLIIGSMEGNNTERYLSMPKNKISSEKGWRRQVTFDLLRAIFKD